MPSVIVTGAASGMGRATVQRLAAKGADVLAVDRNPDGLAMLPKSVVSVAADITDEDQVRAYAREAQRRFGAVDGFFNNAGVAGARVPIVEMDVADWETTMRVNVLGAFLGLKHVLPILHRPGGSVVSTASIAGVRAEPDRADYVVSKHAVIGLTKAAASEVAREGLRVNCICPGPIDTPMMHEHERWVGADAAAARRGIEATNPMGRYGTPEEVASLVEFLLLGESSYINGAVVAIDGGHLAM